MAKWIVFTMVFLIGAAGSGGLAMGSLHSEAIDLRAYQWSHRLLLIGSPSADHSLYRVLVKTLEREAQSLRDRDMLVFHVLESGVSRAGEQPLTPQAAEALRTQLRLASGELTTVLIGKDGGEKWRQSNRVGLNEIFALIDTMPMRRQEMHERGR
jgi:hypothetical protein